MSKKEEADRLPPVEAHRPELRQAKEQGASAVEYTQYIYCGPSIPGRLNENTVLRGTRAEIRRYYADVLERLPQADGLIVPVCRLADTKQRLRTPGNAAYQKYRDIAALLRGGKE